MFRTIITIIKNATNNTNNNQIYKRVPRNRWLVIEMYRKFIIKIYMCNKVFLHFHFFSLLRFYSNFVGVTEKIASTIALWISHNCIWHLVFLGVFFGSVSISRSFIMYICLCVCVYFMDNFRYNLHFIAWSNKSENKAPLCIGCVSCLFM